MPDNEEGDTQGGAGAATPPAGSPPAKSQGQAAGGVVDPAQRRPAGVAPGGSLPKGAQVELFKLRERIRGAQGEIETRDSRIAELERRLADKDVAAEGARRAPRVPDPTTDPEGYMAYLEDRISKQSVARVQADQAEQRRVNDAVEADKWLRSRSHLKEDANFAQMVADRIQQTLSESPKSDLKAVGKAAYLDVCEVLGVDPDLSRTAAVPESHAGAGGRPGPAGNAHAPPKGAPAGAAGDVLNPRAFYDKLAQTKPGSPEWKALQEQVVKAKKEGRWQGDTIKV